MAEKTAYVEGYGCSMNLADTEAIRGFLSRNGFRLTAQEGARLIIINTCAVKEPTEYRMLSRIGKLWEFCRKENESGMGNKKRKGTKKSKGNKKRVLVVFGCLPEISPEKVSAISPEIVQIGPRLEGLAEYLKLPPSRFSPSIEETRTNPFIAVIPISRGCLGACTYCAARNARGPLRSYPPEEINRKFKSALLQGAKEFWLTAQDTGCYGSDLRSKTSLPALLELLLSNHGDYRIRVGMMNPNHLRGFYKRYIKLFRNKNLYRFLHIPLQSGSGRILKLMKRPYTARAFLSLVKKIRKDLPDATISTDIIAGFPTETKEDFRKTISTLRKFKPDIVNISRFGPRPGTEAAEMGQVYGWVKKERSRELSAICRKFALERNRKMAGKCCEVLVTRQGSRGGFAGRAENYKPVVLGRDLRGRFARVKITAAGAACLSAEPM